MFFDEFDYGICEEILSESLEKYRVPLHAYCLMPNHWHLLVEAPRGGILVQMLQRFSSVHAKTIRKRQENQGTGAVYQSRYRAHPVQKSEAFFRVKSYIEDNPCKAGLCSKPEDWRWSTAYSEIYRHILIAPTPTPFNVLRSPLESWHSRIESALFSQRPLGDVEWRNSFCEQDGGTSVQARFAA
jgi:putative transposase